MKKILYGPDGGVVSYSNMYEAANYSRTRRTLQPVLQDADDTNNKFTRDLLMFGARYLYANLGKVKGAVDDFSRYCVGSGIRPQSQIEDQKIADKYEEYFFERGKIIDYAGALSLDDMCRLIMKVMPVDGSLLANMTETDSGDPRIQLIEVHRVSFGKDHPNGVKRDKYGRVISYLIKAGDKDEEINARSICHIYDPSRPSCTWPTTWMHHAINNCLDEIEIIAAEKLGVKDRSEIAFLLKTENPNVPTAGRGLFGATTTSDGITKEAIKGPGAIPRIGREDDIIFHDSDRPSPAFTGFLDWIIRDVATGFGLPFEFVWNPEGVGGAGQRFILEKAQRRFNEVQFILLKFLNRAWAHIISKGYTRGDLPKVPNWWKVSWQLPAKITVDVGRESKANLEEIKSGTRTMLRDIGEQGGDWREHYDQVEFEADYRAEKIQALMKRRGINWEQSASLLGFQPAAPGQDSGESTKEDDTPPKKEKKK